jgi:hypothetical protein
MYFPYSFAELIKEHTHLREGPGDIVYQGKTLLSSFCVHI